MHTIPELLLSQSCKDKPQTEKKKKKKHILEMNIDLKLTYLQCENMELMTYNIVAGPKKCKVMETR